MNSKEYEIIRTLRADHGEITIVTEERRKSVSRAMTFKQMEMHIKQCRNANKRLDAFEKVKALSKIQRSPYNYVKTWFMDNYANYSEQPVFDENGFVVVKTKAEMEAENTPQILKEENFKSFNCRVANSNLYKDLGVESFEIIGNKKRIFFDRYSNIFDKKRN